MSGAIVAPRASRRDRRPSGSRLLADVGGTNVRFAIDRGGGRYGRVTVMRRRDYASLAHVVQAYLDRVDPAHRPNGGAFAVAAPVTGDRVRFTNRPWSFSVRALERRLGFESLRVVNDSAAVALAIPLLRSNHRVKIGRGRRAANGPVAMLGPGTGLGVAGLIPTALGDIALESQGGHVDLPARDDEEATVLAHLRSRFGRVSAERVLSGPGLAALHAAVAEALGPRVCHTTPEMITSRASSGTCAACRQTLDLFCAMLGTTASDLALSLGARGGVYLGGGFIFKILASLQQSSFRRRFESKGRMSAYLRAIPTYVITHPAPALAGLTRLA